MALFRIRPSRGTVAFFLLLGLALVVRSGWGKHEAFLVERDAPPVHTTRRLLRCVLGRDVQRLLWPRPADGETAPWEAKITARLRTYVAARYDATWPSRCVPIADRLTTRLNDLEHASRASRYAADVRTYLAEMSRDRMAAIEQVETGVIGAQLASLAMEMSALSHGAEEGWNYPLAYDATDLDPVPANTVPNAVALPPDADYAMFSLPDLVLYQSALDRRLHVVTFDAGERVRADRAIGRGAPVRGAERDGAVLVASDEGDSVFLPGGEPAQLVRLPAALRGGAPAREPSEGGAAPEPAVAPELLGGWQVALTPGYLWLLSEHDGAVRVRRTPRAGELAWADVATPPDWVDVAGAAFVPEAGRGDVVRVAAARRASVASVAVYAQPVGGDGQPAPDPAAAQGGGAGPAQRARAPQPQRAARQPGQQGDAAAGAGDAIVPEWNAFDPHVTTCAAGAVRYLLVASSESVVVAKVHGGASGRLEIQNAALGTRPHGARFELSCSPQAALLFAEFEQRGPTLALFDFERLQATVLRPPLYGARARVVGATLTDEHGVVVVVSNGHTVRAFRTRRGAARGLAAGPARAEWEGGALLATQRPAVPAAAPDLEARGFDVQAVAAHGNQVALLAWVWHGDVRYVGRLASRDGGLTWRGE